MIESDKWGRGHEAQRWWHSWTMKITTWWLISNNFVFERLIHTRNHFHCKYHKYYHSYYTRIILTMILLVTIAGLSYQTSLNLPASPDFLVLMSHLGDLLLHKCPHSSFLTFKANNKVTAQSSCQRKRRRTMQSQVKRAKILTSNIPAHSQTTQYLAHFLPHSHARVVWAGRTSLVRAGTLLLSC